MGTRGGETRDMGNTGLTIFWTNLQMLNVSSYIDMFMLYCCQYFESFQHQSHMLWKQSIQLDLPLMNFYVSLTGEVNVDITVNDVSHCLKGHATLRPSLMCTLRWE